MRYYPIFLNLRGRSALVIGGGKVAERKVRKLLRAGASVRIISPRLTPGLARLSAERRISVTRRGYRRGDLHARGSREAPLLVFAATNNVAAQQAVREGAQAAGALVNVASDAPQCDFIVPASFTRGALHFAISTSGTNPGLARLLRQQLAAATRKMKRQKSKGKDQK